MVSIVDKPLKDWIMKRTAPSASMAGSLIYGDSTTTLGEFYSRRQAGQASTNDMHTPTFVHSTP